ncbi:M48 family metallopeptidase [Pelotomaculum propionicicum]|uniref:Protease HtpX n=1 Tax=Pelotomaculum propionicicum TaxID=258475 RepID=A0A4Y7RSW2_9FIRM|nr:M48 family metallopeptidase [Pelotomaculum propionicicum]TEB11951.1 Protease HtpX [Pelotomaculum propionicicum]
MQPRFNIIWLILITGAGVLGLLYLWYTLFPGRVAADTLLYFSAEQVERGRQYSRAIRLVYIFSVFAQAAFLVWFIYSGRASSLARWSEQTAGGFWTGLLLFFLMLWLFLQLVNLPFTLFSSYFWQHWWGFSTQTMGAWWVDYVKESVISLVLSAAGVLILFRLMGRWPNTWWLAAAAFLSVWILIQTFLWPVVVAPLFNRFTPATDPAVTSMVRDLADKARLPVDEVLIMDASSRTTRTNAYYAGLGSTKRIVLYDTLLKTYPLDEVKAVVAHEMAHWLKGHIIKGLILGILGNFILWVFLFWLLRETVPLLTRNPAAWAVILLFFLLTSFAGSPLQNYISRRMETEADRTSVALTRDVPAAVRLEVDLAVSNLTDVAPAPFVQWFGYSHPPAAVRIKTVEQAGEAL